MKRKKELKRKNQKKNLKNGLEDHLSECQRLVNGHLSAKISCFSYLVKPVKEHLSDHYDHLSSQVKLSRVT